MYTKNDDVKIKNIKLKNKNGFIQAGKDKKTLVNCLIGCNDNSQYDMELNKIKKILKMDVGPNIISDLSIIRKKASESLWYKIANSTPFVSGTLPVYLINHNKDKIDSNELLDIILEQMDNGVGLVTIHPTSNQSVYELCKKRIIPVTSRGGGIILKDIIRKHFKEDNAYVKILPDIIKNAKKNNVTISIGATFRSATIFDSNDEAQQMEIENQIEIAKYIYSRGVDVIIESPGHATPQSIIKISKKLNKTGFPIMPLGPIPTDAAIGMDHVSSSIGATIMGLSGCADIISTVTREEHTGGIPTVGSVIEAIKCAQLAAHIIDMSKIDDYFEDKKIDEFRSKLGTCVYGNDSFSCSRCNKLCPLNIK